MISTCYRCRALKLPGSIDCTCNSRANISSSVLVCQSSGNLRAEFRMRLQDNSGRGGGGDRSSVKYLACRYGVEEFLRAQEGYVKILQEISVMAGDSFDISKEEL
jgi:hypothetical protein